MSGTTTTNTAYPGQTGGQIQGAFSTALGNIQNTPFVPYGGQLVANQNGTQTGAISNQTANASYTPGTTQAGSVTQYAGGSGPHGLSLQGMDLGGYTNPYQGQVVGTSLDELNRNLQKTQQQASGTAAQAGAFGGDRAAIQQTENNRNAGDIAQRMIAGLNLSGYQNAQGLASADLNRELGAGTTQAQLGLASDQGNQSAGLQGANLRNGANAALFQMGTQGQQTDQARLAADYGQFLRQQQYPLQQSQMLGATVGRFNPALGGMASRQVVSPNPSTASQVAGYGLGALGLGSALGGAGGLGGLASTAWDGLKSGYNSLFGSDPYSNFGSQSSWDSAPNFSGWGGSGAGDALVSGGNGAIDTVSTFRHGGAVGYAEGGDVGGDPSWVSAEDGPPGLGAFDLGAERERLGFAPHTDRHGDYRIAGAWQPNPATLPAALTDDVPDVFASPDAGSGLGLAGLSAQAGPPTSNGSSPPPVVVEPPKQPAAPPATMSVDNGSWDDGQQGDVQAGGDSQQEGRPDPAQRIGNGPTRLEASASPSSPLPEPERLVAAGQAPQGLAGLPRTQASAGAASAPGNDWAMPVLAAGLAMLGGTSPNAGVNIGRGGLAGVEAYRQQQNDRIKQAYQSALTKNAGLDAVGKTFLNNVARNNLNFQNRIYDMPQVDEQGNPIPGTEYMVPGGGLPSVAGGPGLPGYAAAVNQRESGGDPNARPLDANGNPRSSAYGPSQAIEGTWKDFAAANPNLFQGMNQQQVMAARSDPGLAAKFTDWYAGQNATALKSAGIPATPANLALAHRFGPGDAVRVLAAPADASIADTLAMGGPEHAQAVIAANPELGRATAGSVRATFEKQFANVPGGPGLAGNYQVAAGGNSASDVGGNPLAPPSAGAVLQSRVQPPAPIPMDQISLAQAYYKGLLPNPTPQQAGILAPALARMGDAAAATKMMELANIGQSTTATESAKLPFTIQAERAKPYVLSRPGSIRTDPLTGETTVTPIMHETINPDGSKSLTPFHPGTGLPMTATGTATTQSPVDQAYQTKRGDDLAAYQTKVSADADNAIGLNNTWQNMRASAPSIPMGAGASTLQAANAWLLQAGKAAGMDVSGLAQKVASGEDFNKNSVALVSAATKAVSARASQQEMQYIAKSQPSQDMSRGGFNMIADQMQGVQDYSIGKQAALQKWLNGDPDSGMRPHKSPEGFDTWYNQQTSPAAFTINRMSATPEGQERFKAMIADLQKTPEGQAGLRSMLAHYNKAKAAGLFNNGAQ
jgi:hypothetical protein